MSDKIAEITVNEYGVRTITCGLSEFEIIGDQLMCGRIPVNLDVDKLESLHAVLHAWHVARKTGHVSKSILRRLEIQDSDHA